MSRAGLGALEIENERLRSELDTLRQHATATPTVRLRELNERQVGACWPVCLCTGEQAFPASCKEWHWLLFVTLDLA